MAGRPRRIKYPSGGEVKFSGFSKEEADELVNKLKFGEVRNTDESEEDEPVEKEVSSVAVPANLTEPAIGLFYHQEEKKWSVVHLLYNLETKQAMVVELENGGVEKNQANYKFRTAAIAKKIVKAI